MILYEIYFSPTGGTKQAADILSSQWDCEKVEIDLSNPRLDFQDYKIRKEDICIVAAPVYGGRIPLTASANLSRLKGNGAKAAAVAVYGNRAYEDALLELKDDLEEAGFCCKAGVAAIAEHSIARQFAAGRPDEEDRKQLGLFAETILGVFEEDDKEAVLHLPGNYPYKEYKVVPVIPEANNSCTLCGLCAELCPTGAISPVNLKTADPSRCISCMRCIAVCPEEARGLSSALQEKFSQKLSKVCAERRENELFCPVRGE